MFSVVIPLYNKEQSIGNTIQSVLNQTYQDIEIIIVNDGSTDNSLRVVEQINDSRIRIINKENGGVSSARNRGIKEARFNWIAFIDADDLWVNTYLEEMNQFIVDYPDASMYGCAFDNIYKGEITNRNKNLPTNFKGIVSDYFSQANKNILFCSSATIVSKSSLKEMKGFDERISLGEDLDLWFRIAYNYKIAFYNKVMAYYNQDASNRAMNKKHEFNKNYLFYTGKFKKWEKDHTEFRLFINKNRISHLVEVFKNYSHDKVATKKYLAEIDYRGQELKYLLFSKLPFDLKKLAIRLLY